MVEYRMSHNLKSISESQKTTFSMSDFIVGGVPIWYMDRNSNNIEVESIDYRVSLGNYHLLNVVDGKVAIKLAKRTLVNPFKEIRVPTSRLLVEFNNLKRSITFRHQMYTSLLGYYYLSDDIIMHIDHCVENGLYTCIFYSVDTATKTICGYSKKIMVFDSLYSITGDASQVEFMSHSFTSLKPVYMEMITKFHESSLPFMD